MKIVNFKADINSDIPLDRAAIFFLANIGLKQGISSEYVMVYNIPTSQCFYKGNVQFHRNVGCTKKMRVRYFICVLGLTRAARNASRELQNSCPKGDLNPIPSAYEANALTIALLDLISFEHLKVDRVLPECAIKIYLCHMVDVVKIFCCVFHFIKSSSQQMS